MLASVEEVTHNDTTDKHVCNNIPEENAQVDGEIIPDALKHSTEESPSNTAEAQDTLEASMEISTPDEHTEPKVTPVQSNDDTSKYYFRNRSWSEGHL